MRAYLTVLSLLLTTVLGCERQADAAVAATSTASAAAAPTARPAIARVVFVDLEDACACTRERIDQSWAALQQALGDPARYPVERIHQDSQAPLAEPWLKARPLMVPPGLYFVDASGAVVEQLQGEVAADQIQVVLSAH